MSGQTGAVVGASSMELNSLAQRVERGELPELEEFERVTKAGDRTMRAHAKRLMSHVLLRHAQEDAAQIMVEACEDLDYLQPRVLLEALQGVRGLGRPRAVVDFCLRASERLASGRQYVSALVHLQNAITTDISSGSEGVNSPDFVRRTAGLYERIARELESALGVKSCERGVRRSKPGQPLRMAHITAQLIDGGHAPSRSIETMMKFADRNRFKSYLCVTESLCQHVEHAGQMFGSTLSTERGPERIERFEQELGIPVLRPRTMDSCVAAAKDLHRQFAEHEIDIAFFHGSLATPTEWLMCAWQSAPWQADAGFGIPLHCPRVDYQFFEFKNSMEELAFQCRERGIAYGLKEAGADMSHVEEATAFTREELRIPVDHVILGTIGNHLPKRMSDEFCATTAAIMRKHPKTTFLAVGPGDFARHKQVFGEDLCEGETPRVRFAGFVYEPAQMTKAFDIYLNSFPDGGGFVLGDAMAAGKPVAAIVVNDSTYAQAGAAWLGDEYVIKPATAEAFAARVGELIEDSEKREEFGRQMRLQYEKKHDPRRWVNHMNDRILEIIEAGGGA